jgi:hypothetical protein
MALKTDGSLWVWGLNSDNQLGLNNGGANISVPTRITGNLWLQIAATWDRSFGILSNSSLWGWGYNVDGGVNPGAGSSLPLPVQIGTATDWKDVAAGGCHALGLKNDGTLYGWGCNDVGNLGRGNTSGPPGDIQPVCNVTGQPCSGGKYLAISAGVEASLALKTDGTLWSWGGNAGGSLGNGTTTLSAYPKKISLSPNTLTGAQASLSSGSTKNLTNEGPDDWSHWGNLSATSFDKKAGITSRIGGYAPIGSFTAARYTSGLTTHTWSDGVSPTFSASTKTGVSTSVTATGFQVSVNTLPTEQKLRVYVGVNNARGKLDASLSDGSVVSYVNNALTSAGVLDGYYDLTFSSVTSGAKLNVKWTKESGSGSVNLQSAVLK